MPVLSPLSEPQLVDCDLVDSICNGVFVAIEADQSSFQPSRSEYEQIVKLVRRTRTSKRRSCPRGGVGIMHP